MRPGKNAEEEEEEEEESDDVKQRGEASHQNVHVNGDRGVKEEEKEEEKKDKEEEEKEEHVAELTSHQVSEAQLDQEVAAEKETDTVTETKTQRQAEEGATTDPQPVSSTQVQAQEPAAVESEVQQEQAELCAPQASAEETDDDKSAHPDDECDESSAGDGQETVSESNTAVSSEVDVGEHAAEMNAASQKAFAPPANPPPPPNALKNSSEEEAR